MEDKGTSFKFIEETIFEEPMNIIENHWKSLENFLIRGQFATRIVGNTRIPE